MNIFNGKLTSRVWVRLLVVVALPGLTRNSLQAQGNSLLTGLVSYWPMDVVQGTKTPDLKSGYDLNLNGMDAGDLITGQRGMGFHFTPADNAYLFRVHAAGDDLPLNKHASSTLSFWTRTNHAGQNDKRLFSEGSNATNDPLFTIGTHSGGGDPSLDFFVRQNGAEIDHIRTFTQPLDGVDWRHIVVVQTAQPDNTATRQVYIDGVLDGQTFANRPAAKVYNMNITSFGAVLRTAVSAQVNGDIDEAAIWKRALSQAEITDLFTNGMPSLAPPPEPLRINAFTRDFRNVSAGGTVRLRWDVTKDATITLSPGMTNVTPLSSFGVGATDVTVTAPTTYSLTASRGAETPVTATVTVNTISGVAAGWRWVEDFQDLNIAVLGGQGRWLAADGAFNVVTSGSTKAMATTGGVDLTALDLRSLRVAENSSATLFFRFCYQETQPDLPIDLKVGLTEKTIRFNGDFGNNIGTYIKFNRFAASPLTLQAINGQGGAEEDAPLAFESGKVYNVWIDVTNNPLTSTDLFSVHVGLAGSGTRQTVFANFASDRTPDEVPLLGFPQPDINFVFAVAATADQAAADVVLDDFYLSTEGSFSISEPVPSSFGKGGPAIDFRITGFTYTKATGQVSLTWNSSPGETYRIWTSTAASGWQATGNAIPSQGNTTTTTLTGPFAGPRAFFQVRR